MTATQVYEQAIKPLSAEDKLTIARLIITDVVPAPVPEAQEEGSGTVATGGKVRTVQRML